VIAGARQYHHAKLVMFEGYAGTSASGFAAEVAAEENIATLDYLEDLYRDWDAGARGAGGDAARIDARVRPRPQRTRRPAWHHRRPAPAAAILAHLTRTLCPGTLNNNGLFRVALLPYPLGVRKPDPLFYRLVLAAAESPPGQVLFVGDNLDCDVAAPIAYGMRAALVCLDGLRPGGALPDGALLIRHVRDLPALLETT
jgi:HAD-hyrolase-like